MWKKNNLAKLTKDNRKSITLLRQNCERFRDEVDENLKFWKNVTNDQ